MHSSLSRPARVQEIYRARLGSRDAGCHGVHKSRSHRAASESAAVDGGAQRLGLPSKGCYDARATLTIAECFGVFFTTWSVVACAAESPQRCPLRKLRRRMYS